MKHLMTSYLVSCAMALIATACSGVAHAAEAATESGLAVAPLFTDRMILQEGMPVAVWGQGTPSP